jgi:hypothetical protein
MNRSDDSAVLAEIQTLAQQNCGGTVEGCIICTRCCKIVVAFCRQVSSRLDRLLGSFKVGGDLLIVFWHHTTIPSRLAFR